jgi:tetratricopeptide (TPR) repeat protein
MQTALEQALHLQFPQALESAAQLEGPQYSPLAPRLTRGMIAYFQWRWQTRPSPVPHKTSHTLLQEVLDEGQKRLPTSPRDSQLLLFLGLAAAFDALLQQGDAAWHSLQVLHQGKTWLQQALVADAATTDAHLGLGLLYFVSADLPPWLRQVWEKVGGLSTEAARHHLQQAVAGGHFTRHVAQTFLAQLYILEKHYSAAQDLAQTLQDTFPDNGYYALLTGRSQCAQRQYDLCAKTLERLVSRDQATESFVVPQDDRLEMYYYLGIAHNEMGQYDQAFEALRQAINEDPRNQRDESLWAKYHLAALYERRGHQTTARQLYRTLLRGRNVDDLHRRVQQRLARFP